MEPFGLLVVIKLEEDMASTNSTEKPGLEFQAEQQISQLIATDDHLSQIVTDIPTGTKTLFSNHQLQKDSTSTVPATTLKRRSS